MLLETIKQRYGNDAAYFWPTWRKEYGMREALALAREHGVMAGKPRILVTYGTIEPAPVLPDGRPAYDVCDFTDRGWEDSVGSWPVSEWDDESPAEVVAQWLLDAGVTECSSSQPGNGDWYTARDTGSRAYFERGTETEYNYHFQDVPPCLVAAIHKEMAARLRW